MGLDNGVNIRRNEKTNKIKKLEVFSETWDKELQYDFSVCYYRKAWNIRNDLFRIGIGYDEDEYPMTTQDVEKMINLLKSYNSENFENGGYCIWDFDDEEYPYSKKIKQDIKNLKKLKKLMGKYDLEVYFYDSY